MKLQVPLLDLETQYKRIEKEIDSAIKRVCESGQFILGDEVAKFEEEVASYCSVNYGIGVSSGTDALLISLMALGIGPDDEVITSAYSFFATAGVISRLLAKPVFVDIEPDTFNINPSLIEERINERTKAILPVHLFGQVAEMAPIMEISKKYNIPIVEDAAQAIGAQYRDGKVAGTIGNLGSLSFFPTKNLGGFGDGGMVLTKAEELAERIRILRVHGAKPKYYHKIIGGNFRLDSLQAAILRVKLKYLDHWTEKRQKNSKNYERLFSERNLEEFIRLPKAVYHHIYNQFIIRVNPVLEWRDSSRTEQSKLCNYSTASSATPCRDRLRDFLKKNGVSTEVYYPLPLPLQECFKELGHKEGDFPEAERAAKETLSLPVYPEITLEMQEYVVEKIKEFFT